MPKVSVIMPVYNAGLYLHRAVSSILSQTFQDFEFLVIDDGSTDGSQEVVRSFSDKRIRFIQNSQNTGVASTLNKGLNLASSKYIARMDGDDISAPTRLISQVALLERKCHLGICGAWVRTLDCNGKGHVIRFPRDAETIRSFILFNNPLNHPVVMMRKSLIEKYQLRYDQSCLAAQDYEFWSRCLACFDAENIPKALLTWRINKAGMTHRNFENSNEVAMTVQARELARLGFQANAIDFGFHRAVGNSSGVGCLKDLVRARMWLEQLILMNNRSRYYPIAGLKRATALIWFNLCVNSSGTGLAVPAEYLRASFKRHYFPPVQHLAFFILNSMVKIRKVPVGDLLGSK